MDATPLCEGEPVTLQIGICAIDGSLVVASDTRHKTSANGVVSGRSNSPKIIQVGKHDALVAFAGVGDFGNHPGEALAAYLAEIDPLPDPLDPALRQWGNEFFKKSKYGPLERDRDMPLCRLLIVSPKSRCPFFKLLVNRTSEVYGEFNCVIHGDESNAAVFWPQYLRAHDGKLDLRSATSVAATTVLMGNQITPDTVSGLELYRYGQQKWKQVPRQDVIEIEQRFASCQDAIKASVFGMYI